MKDSIKMDSHKLIYHPKAVNDWMSGKNIYPVEVEISPSGACNHRCIFCGVDYIGYHPDFLKKEILLNNLDLMFRKGLKSVICSGEGEPLLNPDLPDMANRMKKIGLDVALASNAVLLTQEKSRECLDAFKWVRFSVASLNEITYNEIHRGKKGDLEKVKKNISDAVKVKKEQKFKTTLGVQCLLIPKSAEHVVEMAKELQEIGVDYFTIKPYSQHIHSKNHFEVDYEQCMELELKLKEYETDSYKIYFRANAMQKMHKEKAYPKCYGLPFMAHIDAKGNVWPCVAHIGAEEYCYGNIYENSFEEIWEGSRRQSVTDKLYGQDINQICREACRLDEINKYLHELKNPGEHVNFI